MNSSRGKWFAYGIGAFLLLLSAARYLASGDLPGALIAGGAGLLAIHCIRQDWYRAAQEDAESDLP